MKLKTIMLLIAVSLAFVSGEFCKGQLLNPKFESSLFQGVTKFYNREEIKKAIAGMSPKEHLEILTLTPDKLAFNSYQNGEENNITRNILNSNLVCKQCEKNKVCLLEYITIKSGIFLLEQIGFHYEKDNSLPDCEDELRKRLENEEVKFCRVENIEYSFQIFSIPLKDGKTIKFNTKVRKFELNGAYIPREESTVNIGEDIVTLTVDEMTYDFKGIESSCFPLLMKIQSLLQKETCSDDTKLFNYYHLTKGKEEPEDKIPNEGKINLADLNNIKLGNFEGFTFDYYDENDAPQNNLPVYEKHILKLFMSERNDVDSPYETYVDFSSEECLRRIKKSFLSHHSCSSPYDSLVYYKEVDLQNKNILDDLEGNFEVLRFKIEEGNVRDMGTLNNIKIYDMNMNGEWLFIKGLDTEGKIINKKYLVKISDNNYCKKIYKEIKKELSTFYEEWARKNIFFFWESKSQENDKLGSVAFVANGKISIEGRNSQNHNYYIDGNSLVLNVDGIEIIYKTSCTNCLKILEEKLKKTPGTIEPKQGKISKPGR
jgi:hypothetical protein